jgi:hypothetical protein
MSALIDLQRQFQEHILNEDPAILGSIENAQSVDAAARMSVYAQAYGFRLTEALASNFPRLHRWLGAESFAAIAAPYMASHPSHFRSIRWVGAQLPACLELSHPDEPWLADLAQWEWALAASFDAADAEPLADADFAAAAPERWPSLRFDFHPAVRLVRVDTNAPALFKALADGDSPPTPALLAAPQAWLIWRGALSARYRPLDATEQGALESALSGGAFEDVCDALCETLPIDAVPLRAAALLKSWIADGLIIHMRD